LICLVTCAPKVAFARQVCSFEGQVDLANRKMDLVVNFPEGSSVTATASKMSETNYHFLLDVNHLKTPLFDLLTKIESSVDLVPTEDSPTKLVDSALQGKIWSQYSLVDYKPINELSGRFEVRDKRLYIMAASIGNLTLNGYVGLTPPYALEGTVRLFGVQMKDFLNFWGSGKEYESSGEVFGEIEASGSPENLVLKGNLESRDGFVEKLDYNAIVLNIEGTYPLMEIANSTISQSDGVSFSFDGPIDLSDKENFKKQIKALTLAPLVSDSGSELEWTIKRRGPEESGGVELKYHLKKGDALGTGPSAGDEIDMLGIERTKKF